MDVLQCSLVDGYHNFGRMQPCKGLRKTRVTKQKITINIFTNHISYICHCWYITDLKSLDSLKGSQSWKCSIKKHENLYHNRILLLIQNIQLMFSGYLQIWMLSWGYKYLNLLQIVFFWVVAHIIFFLHSNNFKKHL